MPSVHSTLEEVVAFLERHPPFSGLDPDTLVALARSAEIEYFPRATVLLRQEGPPATSLFTVYRGSVELLDGGDVIDILEAGESFGHPSLVSGSPPALEARAREDTLCFLFPSVAATRALANPEGLRFMAASLEERLRWAAARSRGASLWGVGRVGERARAALVLDAGLPIREAAARMTADGTAVAVMHWTDRPPSLVSDSDLRAHVVTGHVSADDPLSALPPGATVIASDDRVILDVAVEMLESGAEHAVVVDPRGSLVGIVDHAALLDLDAPSPFALRHRIDHARDVSSVAAAAKSVPRIAVRLLDAGAGARDVLEILAATTDAVTRRLTELARSELGEPPASWAWLSLGSEARREQTLATDQDNALAYDDAVDDADRYFAAFASRMNAWLVECGYRECPAGVMATNLGWRLTRAGWLELIGEWLAAPTRRDVHMAMIGFDHRQVAGPLNLDHEVDALLSSAAEHPYLMERLTRSALELRPPLGFLGGLVVEHGGTHAGTLDLKRVGTAPVVNLARRHALAAGSTTKPTIERLRAAVACGVLSSESGSELEDAFLTISRVRLQHQAAQVEHGEPPDNHVDPEQLASSERRGLKDAFRAVARAQRDLEPRTATRIP